MALVPERAARIDAERARAVARRRPPARRERRQQHGGGGRRPRAGAQRGRGLHSDRLVSDGRAVQQGREDDLRAERQGADLGGRIRAAPSAGVPGSGDGQYTGAMLQGSLSILPVPDAATLQAMTKTVYSLTPLTSAGVLAPASAARRLADPEEGGRPVAHQARLLHHPREPHLRPDPRRPRARQRRSEPLPVRRGRSRRTRTPSRASSSCSTTSTSTPRSATTATRTRPARTPPTSSRRSGRPTTASRGGRYLSEGGGKMRNAVRQRHRADERLHLGRVHAGRRERAQLRRVRRARA